MSVWLVYGRVTVALLLDTPTTLFETVTGPCTAPPPLCGMRWVRTRTWLFCTMPLVVSRRCRLTVRFPVVRPPPTRTFATPVVFVAYASYDWLGVTAAICPVWEA